MIIVILLIMFVLLLLQYVTLKPKRVINLSIFDDNTYWTHEHGKHKHLSTTTETKTDDKSLIDTLAQKAENQTQVIEEP
jgi:hypothetical protein